MRERNLRIRNLYTPGHKSLDSEGKIGLCKMISSEISQFFLSRYFFNIFANLVIFAFSHDIEAP